MLRYPATRHPTRQKQVLVERSSVNIGGGNSTDQAAASIVAWTSTVNMHVNHEDYGEEMPYHSRMNSSTRHQSSWPPQLLPNPRAGYLAPPQTMNAHGREHPERNCLPFGNNVQGNSPVGYVFNVRSGEPSSTDAWSSPATNSNGPVWSPHGPQDPYFGQQVVSPGPEPPQSLSLSRSPSDRSWNHDSNRRKYEGPFRSISDETLKQHGMYYHGQANEMFPNQGCTSPRVQSYNSPRDPDQSSILVSPGFDNGISQLQQTVSMNASIMDEWRSGNQPGQIVSQYSSHDQHEAPGYNGKSMQSMQTPIPMSPGPSPGGGSSELSSPQSPVLRCGYPHCKQTFKGDSRAGNRKRHMKSAHRDQIGQVLSCSEPRCTKKFKRSDSRLKHERKKHPELQRLPPRKRAEA
ncbi:hypothetical protein BU16DRAFT_538844 [Lophium mytilinum]|uniref:C2H2-type domain-containing protein n=1 Tax=Lophium mytilinum TaxID=390894 RepID=A0A6A6QVU9_9PEZI|nr:hypothetical protein BU16DRAFT_538844 [Lophium mytilinum]